MPDGISAGYLKRISYIRGRTASYVNKLIAGQDIDNVYFTGGSITGIALNGVTLQSGGSTSSYLNAFGTYTTPAGGGGTSAYRSIATGPVTVLATDQIIEAIPASVMAITFNLPASPVIGFTQSIKDGANNGSSYTLVPASGTFDNGQTSVTFSSGGSLSYYYNGSNFRII